LHHDVPFSRSRAYLPAGPWCYSCTTDCMRFRAWFLLLGVAICLAPRSSSADASQAQDIVNRSVEQNEKDWALQPQYSFTERDVVTRGNKVKRQTFRVLMIDGSPYNELIAENGQPLSESRAIAERQRLNAEIAKRNGESASARRQRIADYQRTRQHEHTLMREMTKAFQFRLTGHEEVNGHDCYVLEATPNPAYQPTSKETKVLTGMRGKMWIDSRGYHWVKVQARVVRPVSMAFFMAHVRPGTQFTLEQEQLSDGAWLPTHFQTKVNATGLLLWSKKYTSDETYSEYQRVNGESAPASASK